MIVRSSVGKVFFHIRSHLVRHLPHSFGDRLSVRLRWKNEGRPTTKGDDHVGIVPLGAS